MQSIGEILQLRGLRGVLIPSDVEPPVEERAHTEAELAAIQGVHERKRPTWAIGECSACSAFLGRGQYRRPKGGKGITCKKAKCISLYSGLLRRSGNLA
jgi:hypothetical protein